MAREMEQLQAARCALLPEIVLLLSGTADLQRLQKQPTGKVIGVLGFDRCTLALLNDGAQTYELRTLLETRHDIPQIAETALPWHGASLAP
jgi:hypothetical protein